MERQELVNRYMAYCTEEMVLMRKLDIDKASSGKQARRETRLQRLQNILIPKLQGELQATFNARILV